MIFPTADNLDKVIAIVRFFLSNPIQTAQRWQSLIGILSAQDRFIPWGRFRVRPVQLFLQDHWRPATGRQEDLIPSPVSITQELTWWTVRDNLSQGVPLELPQFNCRLFTDASTKGWGAHLDGEEVQGLWSQEETALHINVLEMRAVRLGLESLQVPSGAVILVSTDSKTVVAYINRQGGTRSRSLWLETRPLIQLAIAQGWLLRAKHIPGRLNVIADQLSRDGQVLPTEWSLQQEVADWVFQSWGRPLLDLFATRYNNKLPTFVSPVPDKQALETDALSMDWEGLWAYAYPPHQILPQVMQKFRQTKKCKLILIAPRWPKQVWFPELQQLVVQDPIQLPKKEHLLKQPRSNVYHSNVELLDLHAWLLLRGC